MSRLQGVTNGPLCSKCGEPVRVPAYEQHFRLCHKHLAEARRNTPPFFCTTADIDAGYEGTGDELPLPKADVVPINRARRSTESEK